MSRIQRLQTAAPDRQTIRKSPARIARPLPAADRQHLERHLMRCAADDTPAAPLLRHVLDYKVQSTTPLDGECPRDLVCSGRLVTWSIDGGPARTGLMSHRARAGSPSGVIAVASLLGATLMGMRVGQHAPLLREDGSILSLEVLKVSDPA